MLLKPFDFGIMIPALGAVIASFLIVYMGGDGQRSIHLKSEGGEWVFPADADETMVVSGPLGDTVIEIIDGAARVVSSPCQNQTCVAAGAVRLPGQWAACLPNRIMLYICTGGNDTDVDAAVW